jgi:hypothetical protein
MLHGEAMLRGESIVRSNPVMLSDAVMPRTANVRRMTIAGRHRSEKSREKLAALSWTGRSE